MSEETARLVARLRDRLRQTTRRITRAEFAFGVAVAGGCIAGIWLIATLLEASLWLGTAARTALAATFLTVVIGVAGTVLARPLGCLLGLLSGPSEEEVARRVGKHHPTVADRLVNLLQLAEGKRSHAPAPLVDQAVHHLADDLDEVSFEAVEDFGRARQALRLASLPVAGVLAFLLVAPATFLGASERLLSPNTEFDRPAPFELSVAPGDTRLVQGDSLAITIRTTGASPTSLSLHTRDSSGAPINRRSLQADSKGTYQHTRSTVRRSFQYRIDAPPLRTDWYDVTVTQRPLVRQLQLTVTPPAYTDLPTRTLDPNVGDVAGLPGSQVQVTATLGGPSVQTATLEFDDGTERSLDVGDGTAEGSFPVQREDTYSLRLQSNTGTSNRDPIEYQVSLQSDARPSVSFLQPAGTADLEADLTQTLRLELSDDYGFSQAKLYYRFSDQRFGDEQEEFSSLSLPLPGTDQSSFELTHEWLLAQESGLDPEPGEAIVYYVKAWDNDTVNGPKSGRSATQRLRRPSLSEQYEELDETQSEAGEQMDQLRERSDSVRQQFQQLRDELRRTREADWQDRQQLEQIQKKQESVEQGVKKLSDTVQKMNRQMQKNGLSSPETMKKFRELQRVIKETKSPELQKALDQLKKAMQENDLRQMQQAMEEVQKNEKSYQEQLERTLSLFKQLKARQKLEEMARRAGDLSKREKRLRDETKERMKTRSDPSDSASGQEEPSESQAGPPDSTGTGDQSSSEDQADGEKTAPSERSESSQTDSSMTGGPKAPSTDSSATKRSGVSSRDSTQNASPNRSGQNEDLAREQEQAAQEMRELLQKMDQASGEMEDVQSAPKQQMQKMQQELKQENLPRQMQENSQKLRQNQLQDAQQQQQRMQNRLQRMQKQLSQMKGQMEGRQRQVNVTGLRSALENTLWLSKRQESLRTTVSDLTSQGPTLRSYARDQKTLSDGLGTVADSLQSLAKRIPQMSQKVKKTSGNALRAMETATTALDERDAGKATGHQKTSMMHLNKLALLLSDLLDNIQQQSSSGSGMSKQQMMQKLQQMSGQQQKLNKQIQNHLNETQGERLSNDNAQRQKELAEQQRQIKQQLQEMDVGSEAKNQIMGDLKKITEQMEETAQELEQRRPSRDLIDRQKQILTRLLNAQKSLRTQGKEQQRRGRGASDDYEQRRPGELQNSGNAEKLRQDLIRALEMGYSSDYEELIRRYFELLERDDPNSP